MYSAVKQKHSYETNHIHVCMMMMNESYSCVKQYLLIHLNEMAYCLQ